MNDRSIREAIEQNKQILNELNSSGKKDKKLKNFKFLRYYLVLYYATVSPIYKREEREINGIQVFGLNYLKKVANALRLNYDRSKIALQVYQDGSNRGEITYVVGNNHYRFFALTDKGKKVCEDVLEEIKNLDIKSMKYINLKKHFR